MKKSSSVLAMLLLLSSSFVMADAGIFAGVVYNFGAKSNFGISLKVLSTDEEDKGAIGAGVSYYPGNDSNKFGMDLSAGYVFKNGAVTLGWDFLQSQSQLGLGFVDTDDDDNDPAAPLMMMVPSDHRLKKDIVYLATLENGIKLYSFKYLWSEKNYVGVMAQDLMSTQDYSHAVRLMPGNYYAVNYAALGLKMISLDSWSNSPENIFHNS